MPVMKCSNGKFKIGEHGLCEYDTKAIAEKAYKGYLGHKHSGKSAQSAPGLLEPHVGRLSELLAQRTGEDASSFVVQYGEDGEVSYVEVVSEAASDAMTLGISGAGYWAAVSRGWDGPYSSADEALASYGRQAKLAQQSIAVGDTLVNEMGEACRVKEINGEYAVLEGKCFIDGYPNGTITVRLDALDKQGNPEYGEKPEDRYWEKEGKSMNKQALNIKFLEAGRLEHGGNPLLWVEVEGYGDVNFILQGGVDIWAGSIRPRLSPEEQKDLDQQLGALWEEHGKDAKQAASKVAVDQETKDYFSTYFMAYGAQLTRDLALKRIARRRIAYTTNSFHLTLEFGRTVVEQAEKLAPGESIKAMDREGRREFVITREFQPTTGDEFSVRTAQSTVGYGNLQDEHGQWVLVDPTYPLKSEPLLVTDQNMATALALNGKMEGIPYKAIAFGKAQILDAAQTAKLAQSADSVKPGDNFEVTESLGGLEAGDKYKVRHVDEDGMAWLYGDIGNKAGTEMTLAHVSKLSGEDTQTQWKKMAKNSVKVAYGQEDDEWYESELKKEKEKAEKAKSGSNLTYAELESGDFGGPVEEVPNQWAQIADNIWECDYSSGAHGAVEKNDVGGNWKFRVTCIGFDGVVSESEYDTLDQAQAQCDMLETPNAHQNDVAKAAVAALKASRTQSAIVAAGVQLLAQGGGLAPTGWTTWNHGHGRAWRKDLDGGRFALATNDDLEIPVDGSTIFVGLYEDEGDTCVVQEYCDKIADIDGLLSAMLSKYPKEAQAPEHEAAAVPAELVAHGLTAFRLGRHLASVTKCAADGETIAYWSEYFGAYGTQWVRSLALRGQKTASIHECIMEAARASRPLVVMVARYGADQARVALRCAAKEKLGTKYNAKARFLVKHAQALIESKDKIAFEGEPTSDTGAQAQLEGGLAAQIKYQGTALPKAFQWVLSKGDEVLDQGDAEFYDEAVESVQASLPKASGKAEAKEKEDTAAIHASVGTEKVSSVTKLASSGGLTEYKVEMKTGKVAWFSVRAGKVENKVGEL